MAKKCKESILNHAGMSLVELLLVIAIISIAVGISGIGISLVFSRDCEKCAKTIDGELATAKMNAMAQKGTFIMTIDALGHSVEVNSSERGTILKETVQSRVTVSFEAIGGTTDLSSAEEISIEFDKSTGKVKTVSSGGATADGTIFKIHCVNDNGKKATTVLVVATGKHYVEYE